MKHILTLLAIASLTTCNGNLLLDYEGSSREASLQEIYLRSLWVVGGQQTTFNPPTPTVTMASQIDVFDPITETWYPNVTTIPTPVTFAGVVGVNGKIYIAGGFSTTGANQNITQIYDIATNTWSTGGNLVEARSNAELFVIGNYLYLTQGVLLNWNGAFANRNTFQRYDLATGLWANRSVVGYENSASFFYNGIIHTVGGRSSATNLGSFHDGYYPIPTGTDTTDTGVTQVAVTRIGSVIDVYTNSYGESYMLLFGGLGANLTGTPLAFPFQGLTTATGSLLSTTYYLKAPFTLPAAWTLHAAPLPLAAAFAAGKVYGNKFYHFGGTKTLPTPSPTNELLILNLTGYPTAPASFYIGPAMPVPRIGHRVVRILSN